MKKVYLLYDESDIEKVYHDVDILNDYGYKVILPLDDDIRDFNEFDNKLDNENILLILNYNGVVKDYTLSFWTKYFYENNQTIMLLNDTSKYEEMNLINNINPIILNGDITRLKNRKNHLLNYFSNEQLEQLKSMNDLYAKAFIVAAFVFKDKKDKSGKPYFDHLFRVSQKLDEEVEQVAGLLHDILEDTDVLARDLKEIGIPDEILEIVKIVTHVEIDKNGMTEKDKLYLYSKEIDKIINSGNIHAIRLKYADMTDNYNIDRLKDLPVEKQDWFNKKYGPQLVKLKKEKRKGDIL